MKQYFQTFLKLPISSTHIPGPAGKVGHDAVESVCNPLGHSSEPVSALKSPRDEVLFSNRFRV
jgi:hypothetical protein